MNTQQAPVVVVAGMLNVTGIDGYTGRRLWEHAVRVPPRIWSIGDVVVVVSDGVQCLRITTGQILWRHDKIYADTVLAAHGIVVAAGGNGVTAFAVDDGRVLWQDSSFKGGDKALAIQAGPSVQADRK